MYTHVHVPIKVYEPDLTEDVFLHEVYIYDLMKGKLSVTITIFGTVYTCSGGSLKSFPGDPFSTWLAQYGHTPLIMQLIVPSV